MSYEIPPNTPVENAPYHNAKESSKRCGAVPRSRRRCRYS